MPPTDKAAKKAVPAIRGYLETLRSLQDRPVSIAVPETRLPDIIADKRFKTQFETGRSQGLFDPEYRANAENNLFGYEQSLPSYQRPVYGHFSDRTLEPSKNVYGYGEWNAVLDPARTKDATITLGDSLGMPGSAVFRPEYGLSFPNRQALRESMRAGYPLLPFIKEATRSADSATSFSDIENLKTLLRVPYIEAQVHKGVPWSDVRALVHNRPGSARDYLDEGPYGGASFLYDLLKKGNVPAYLHADPKGWTPSPKNWRMIEPGMESSRQWRSIPPEALADIGYRDGGEVRAFGEGGAKGVLRKLMTAYHGSPYDFDKFDWSKIGTGEGNQSFGYGHYFAENEDIARHYRDALSKESRQPLGAAERLAQEASIYLNRNGRGAPVENYIRDLMGDHPSLKPFANDDTLVKLIRQYGDLSDSDASTKAWYGLRDRLPKTTPRMYEVGIDADPNDFLHWMKPLDEHITSRIPVEIRDVIDDALDNRGMNPMFYAPEDYTGRHLYQALKHHDVHESLPPIIGSSDWYKGDTTPERHTSAYLESLGIPGIIYPDASSRKPNRDIRNNIVTFENTPVSILRKYEQGGHVESFDEGGQKGALRPTLAQIPKKGFLRFVDDIANWFGGASRKAIDEVNAEAAKTGMEAGRFGHGSAQTGQEWVSVPGVGSPHSVNLAKTPTPTDYARMYMVDPANPENTGYLKFRRDMDARFRPEGFQVHSHPPITSTAQPYGDPGLIRFAIQGGEVGPLAPSLGDLQNWLTPWGVNKHDFSDPRFTSYITGSHPNALMALGAPDYGKGYVYSPGKSHLSPSALLKNAEDVNNQRGELWKAVQASPAVKEILTDYWNPNPTNMWAALHALRLGQHGIPITYDKKTPFGIGYLENAMDDLFKRLSSRGEDIGGLAEGGEVEHYAGGGQKGALSFVRNIFNTLPKEEQEALELIRKSTNKTGREALILGREGDGVTVVTEGTHRAANLPNFYTQFAASEPSPFFTAHTHPSNTLSPSIKDVDIWSNRPHIFQTLPFQTMLINASPQDTVLRMGALRGPAEAAQAAALKRKYDDIEKNTPFTHPKLLDYVKANKFMESRHQLEQQGTVMPQFAKAMIKEAGDKDAWTAGVVPDLFAGAYLDSLARMGVPVAASAEHRIGGTPYLASDVWPEFSSYMRKKGILTEARGGPIAMKEGGGGILTRLFKMATGKPNTVKLPGVGEVPSYPIAELEDIAGQFAKRQGNRYPIESFDPLDPDRAARIAAEYDKLIHNPFDPATKRSYEALIDETMDQYNALKPLGLNFEFLKPGEGNPYKVSPSLGYHDLLEHGRMKVFPTEGGYGTEVQIPDNPLLKKVGRVGNLDDATVNDAFRIVHDIFGHYGPGNPFFRAPGEDRAWRLHGTMFSPDALPAATTELRGQNSWLNFGPHGVRNRTASQDDTIYAPQKAGLLPSWVWEEKADGGMVQEFGKGDVVEEVVKGALRRFSGARRTQEAERLAAEKAALNAGRSKDAPPVSLPPEPRLQTVDDPVRLAFPGIYKHPRDIAQEAVQSIIPESDAMKLLFGVTRGDLDAIAQGRNYSNMQGLPHAFQFPARGRGADVSESVLTPANARRISDITNESLKFDPLRFTRSWYEMEPLWDRATQLGLSPDIQRMLNARIGLHSAVASPVSEVNRGTLANKLINEGRLDDYVNFGGYGTKGITTRHGEYRPSRFEVPGFPADMLDMKSHLAHKSHVNKLLELEDTGSYVANAPKVPTYIQATDPITPDARRPIADSHLARGVGYADVRPSAGSAGVELSGPEYRDFLPWWQKVSDKVGEQPRDLQALIWNVLGPQTGVSYIGPPKLEILSNEIMKAARRLGVSPDMARDMVITGKAAAYASGGAVESWNDSSPPYFDYTTPGDGAGTYEQGANNVAGYADGGWTGNMFLDSSDNLSRAMNARMTYTPEERRALRQQRIEESLPRLADYDADARDFWSSELDNLRAVGYHPAKYGAGALHRIGRAISPEGPSVEDIVTTLSPDMGFRHEYGLVAAPLDLLGIGANLLGASGLVGRVTKPLLTAARPAMSRMVAPTYAPVAAEYAREATGYAEGGQVSGYRFGGEMDQWQGVPGMSMYADGGPVEMKDGGFLHDVLGTLGGRAGNLIPIPVLGPMIGKFAGHLLGNLLEGGTSEIGDDAARDFSMGYVDPDRMGFERGGSVDDDALLYHAIDTQEFSRGGALRYCGGGYAR